MRFPRVLQIASLTTIIAFGFSTKAQDRKEDAGRALKPMATANAAHVGSSPFIPPTANDETFVADTGSSGLDTGCTFRSGGPLVIKFTIGRVLGATGAPGVPTVAAIQKLISQNIVSATTRLEMPAYDVDYDAVISGASPERDVVSVNGNKVPTLYLTGLNDTWVSNRFDIPTEWLNFPADPGTGGTIVPATNTITIDIDTQNTSEVWCTAIDWVSASMQIRRPVVFVHGIFSDGGTWDNATKAPDGISWVQNLAALGMLSDNSLNMGALESIGTNAAQISTKIAALRARWGVDAVNVVTHSKGGIDTREYVAKNAGVDRLIHIGTPNAGSPLADAVQSTAVLIGGVGSALEANLLAGPAGLQLTRPYMFVYNYLYKPNGNVKYATVPGFYHDPPSSWTVIPFLMSITGDGDAVVPLTSVPLPYASNLPMVETTGTDTEAIHFAAAPLGITVAETNAKKFYDAIIPLLTTFENPVATAQLQMSPFAPEHATATPVIPSATARSFVPRPEATPNTVTGRTWSNTGTLQQGGTQSGTIPVDAGSSLTFTLMYPSGDVDLTLTSPGGVVYTAASAVNNASVGFQKGAIPGGNLLTFSFPAVEAGNWTYKIAGTTVTQTGGMGYSVNAWIYGSQIALTGGFAQPAIHSGETLTLVATLTSAGSPLKGATVTAKMSLPDGTPASVTLHDDGTAGDAVAGDGIYSGTFTQTTQAGNYSVVFQATGSSPTFQREDFGLVTVSGSSSKFSGTFTGAAADANGDGLYDQLNITAGVTITKAATYRVVGSLTDSKGNSFMASTESALTTSDSSIKLSFDGTAIYQNGVDGPYTLSLVTLAEVTPSALLVDDQKTNAFVTTAYTAGSFQHPPLAVTGSGSATGVDTNGNKLFDQLNITFDVVAAKAGSYQWSGRLTDKDGIGITLATNSGTLKAGANTLAISFLGSDIGAHGLNGPYQLNDLLMYGTASLSTPHVFTTTNFTASQFEGFIGIKQVSTNTSLTLTSPTSGTPSAGTAVTVTAAVRPNLGTGQPTGTVTFTVDGTAQAPVTIANGLAPITVSLGGGVHVYSATYNGDTDYATSTTSTALSITVSPAVTTLALTGSPATFPYTSTTTLKAVVSSTVAGTIAGNVTFTLVSTSGNTSLGKVAVAKDSSGAYAASLTGVTFKAAGTYMVSAAYDGNASYAAVTSSNLTLTVLDKGDLTLGNVPASISLSYGGKSTFPLTITPANGFTDPVTLTCASLPSGASCQFATSTTASTNTITISPDASGKYPSPVQWTVTAPATRASLERPGNNGILMAILPLFGAVLMLPLLKQRRKTGVLLAVLLSAVSFAMAGCSSSPQASAGPVTSTATLTISSSGTTPISHVYSISITLQ